MNLLVAVERQLPPGYAIQEQIGSGATSWVYAARCDDGAMPLAVKIMHPGLMKEASLDRFRREMQILRALDHPHVVPMRQAGEADGALFFTMPYLDGETLRTRLQREGRLPLGEALGVARDLADALGHVHGRGIVHRDVKPENVLLASGRAYLIDFGFASAPSLTPAGALAADARLTIGTPGYMSPEQATGRRSEDWRSDFFSLGCVLQETLTGRPPFGVGSSHGDVQRRLTAVPEDVRALRPDVPDGVLSILRRSLAASPNDRFPTATFLRMALEGALERHATAAGVDP